MNTKVWWYKYVIKSFKQKNLINLFVFSFYTFLLLLLLLLLLSFFTNIPSSLSLVTNNYLIYNWLCGKYKVNHALLHFIWMLWRLFMLILLKIELPILDKQMLLNYPVQPADSIKAAYKKTNSLASRIHVRRLHNLNIYMWLCLII